jgi:hypothetical protein
MCTLGGSEQRCRLGGIRYVSAQIGEPFAVRKKRAAFLRPFLLHEILNRFLLLQRHCLQRIDNAFAEEVVVPGVALAGRG